MTLCSRDDNIYGKNVACKEGDAMYHPGPTCWPHVALSAVLESISLISIEDFQTAHRR
jgi:hypothetical protein